MCKRSAIAFMFLLFPVFLGSGCRNDLDLALDSDPVPVVYGIISPEDSMHRIRLTHTVGGITRLSEQSSTIESTYFSDAKVLLELRTQSGIVVERKELSRVQGPDRDEGFFGTHPNFFYECPSMQLIDPQPGSKVFYALTIFIPEIRRYVYAETYIPPEPSLQFGKGLHRGTPIDLFPKETENEISIYLQDTLWAEFQVSVHYTEQRVTGNERKKLEYKRQYSAAIRTTHNRFDRMSITEDWFFTLIIYNIKPDTTVISRKFESIEFRMTYADKVFSDYYKAVHYQSDLNDSFYSNIVSGMGMFCAANSRSYPGFTINSRSMDSLMNGICTRGLGFGK